MPARAIINDAVRGRIDTALNRGRCGLWDWDLSRGRIFWSQSMFTLLGLDSRNDLLTFGEVNALVKSDDINLFESPTSSTRQERPIDQTFACITPAATGSGCARAASSPRRRRRRLHLIGIAVDITEQKSLAEGPRQPTAPA